GGAGARDDGAFARAPARRLRRHEDERARPAGRRAVLGPPAARCAGRDAAPLGRGRRAPRSARADDGPRARPRRAARRPARANAPRASVRDLKPRPSRADAARRRRDGREPVHLLLVDDDEGVRALLRATFASLAVELEEAESAAAA